jgi:uncharacterized membrane protein YsdA (DUF1294 family)
MKLWSLPILMLMAGLTYSYWYGYTPVLCSVLYLIASVFSYYLYAKDKKAARSGMWRVPEKTLHLSSLLFGWPGSIVAQRTLRHKTQKSRFQIVFFIMLSLNLCLLLWLHSPSGVQIFHSAITSLTLWVNEQFGSHSGIRVFLTLLDLHHGN